MISKTILDRFNKNALSYVEYKHKTRNVWTTNIKFNYILLAEYKNNGLSSSKPLLPKLSHKKLLILLISKQKAIQCILSVVKVIPLACSASSYPSSFISLSKLRRPSRAQVGLAKGEK